MKKKLSFTLAIAFLGCAVASAQQSTRIDLQKMLAKNS